MAQASFDWDFYDSQATEVDESPSASPDESPDEEQSSVTVFYSELTEAEKRLREYREPDRPGEPPDVNVVRRAVQLYLDAKSGALQARVHPALVNSTEGMQDDSYYVSTATSSALAADDGQPSTSVTGVLPKMKVMHTTNELAPTGQADPTHPLEIKVRDGTYRGPLLRVELENEDQLNEWNARTGRKDVYAVDENGKPLPLLRFPESFATATEHTVGVLNYNGNVLATQGGRVTSGSMFLSKPAEPVPTRFSCKEFGFDGAVLGRLGLVFPNDQFVGPMHLGDRDTSTDTSGWVLRTRVGVDGDPNGGCHVLGTHCFSTMKQLPQAVKWPTPEQAGVVDATSLAAYLPDTFKMEQGQPANLQAYGREGIFSEDYLFALRCDWKDNMPVWSSAAPAKLLSPFGVFELEFLDRSGPIGSSERVFEAIKSANSIDTTITTIVKLTFVPGLHVFDPDIHPPEFQTVRPGTTVQCTGTWLPLPGAHFRVHKESLKTPDSHVPSTQLLPLVVVGHTDYAATLASGEASAPPVPRSMFSARQTLVDTALPTKKQDLESCTLLRRCGDEALAAVKALFAASDPRMHGQSAKAAAYLKPPAAKGADFHGLVNEPYGQLEPVAVFEIDYAKDGAVSTRYQAAAERVASELGENVDPDKNMHQSVASDLDRRVLPTSMRTPENPRGTDAAIDPFFDTDHKRRFDLANRTADDMDDDDLGAWKKKSDAAGNLTMNVFTRTHVPLERACATEREEFVTDVAARSANQSATRAADGATWGLAPLRSELNESLLLCGVRAADVKDAIESGLDASFHTSGEFGDGLYLYEDAFAADHDAGLVCEGSAREGAGPRPTEQCPRRKPEDRAIAAALGLVPELHLGDAASSHLDEREVDRSKRENVASELDGYGDLFYALVVRTALGAPAVVTKMQVEKNCVGGTHTTFDEDFERAARDGQGSTGAELFVEREGAGTTRRLRKGLHSLIGFGCGSVDDSGFGALTSGAGLNNRGQIATHRTFVVPAIDDQLVAAVKPVMLVAYKRIKAMPAEFDRHVLGLTTLERPLADPFAPPNFLSERWREHFLQFPSFYQYMLSAVQPQSRLPRAYTDMRTGFKPVDSKIYMPASSREWGNELTDDHPRSGMCPTKGVLFAKDGTPSVPSALGCQR
jgi:hypothetical protein